MKLIKLKNYISFNLLAVLGYITLIVYLYYIFIASPQGFALDHYDYLFGDRNDLMMNHTKKFDALISYVLFEIISIIGLMFTAFLEWVIKKYKKPKQIKEPSEKELKAHLIILKIGFILLFMPIYTLIYVLIASTLSLKYNINFLPFV